MSGKRQDRADGERRAAQDQPQPRQCLPDPVRHGSPVFYDDTCNPEGAHGHERDAQWDVDAGERKHRAQSEERSGDVSLDLSHLPLDRAEEIRLFFAGGRSSPSAA